MHQLRRYQLISHFLGQPGMGWGGYNSGQERLQDRTDAGVEDMCAPWSLVSSQWTLFFSLLGVNITA